MAKTNRYDLCKDYILKSFDQTKRDLDCCNTKLNTQVQSWIPTLPSLEILDTNLKKFVQAQNKRLSNNIEKQLSQYKDISDERNAFEKILSLHLTPNDQVCKSIYA